VNETCLNYVVVIDKLSFLVRLNWQVHNLQFDRFIEVRNGLESALGEMERAAAELRTMSREHGVRVAKVAADVDGRYVHMVVMSRACGKMDNIVEKLENSANKLFHLVPEESPAREVQEEYFSFNYNIDNLGWV
jgi:hypothetical protein